MSTTRCTRRTYKGSSTSGPAQLSLHVLDDRAGLCYCLAQAIARHAELLAPIRELVVLIDVDARVVRTSYFLLVVRHIHLLSSHEEQPPCRRSVSPVAIGRRHRLHCPRLAKERGGGHDARSLDIPHVR